MKQKILQMILAHWFAAQKILEYSHPWYWPLTDPQETSPGFPAMINKCDFSYASLCTCTESTPTHRSSPHVEKQHCLKQKKAKKKEKKGKKSCFFFLTNGHEIRGRHVPVQVTAARLLRVTIPTAPSINGSPKINVAWKLCSKTVTAQLKGWPSENHGLRWKNYFMPCTKANTTVQRDLQLIFLVIKSGLLVNSSETAMPDKETVIKAFNLGGIINYIHRDTRSWHSGV